MRALKLTLQFLHRVWYNRFMTQTEALRILKTGVNVFLTGEPGSGKTHTLNTYITWLRSEGIEPAITASTGIAATHIGGMTIHSWSGIGVRERLSLRDLEDILGNEKVVKRIRNTHVLIIDEVSMLSGSVLTMVAQVTRAVKGNDKPFGGLQVVVVGDFFQLPPVVRAHAVRVADEYSDDEGMVVEDVEMEVATPHSFAFGSKAWERLNPIVCYLEEQHRHEDASLSSLLAAMRDGDIDETHVELLESKRHGTITEGTPYLYTHNLDVDRLNTEQLDALPGVVKYFVMTERGAAHLIDSLKRGCLSPERLALKVGARVMFTKNDPQGAYVNGTLGTVVAFASDGVPRVELSDGRIIDVEPVEWHMMDGARILARISQLPLRLAWAITVHKSQGMTMDRAAIDLSKAFEYGQGYVALSRVRSLDGLVLFGFSAQALRVHPIVSEYDAQFRSQSEIAHATFEAIPAAEYEEMVRRFVDACGGAAGKVMQKKRALKEKVPKEKGGTYQMTQTMVEAGKKIHDIALERMLSEGTIIDHIDRLYMEGKLEKDAIERVLPTALKKALPKIHAAFKELKTESLTPVHQYLKGVYSFNDIKLARLLR
jgi:hypothetical protein